MTETTIARVLRILLRSLLAGRTIVPPNEAVAILGQELSFVRVLFRLLHGDIQIAVQTAENAPIFHPRVEAHADGAAQEAFQKVGRFLRKKDI